MDTSGLILRRSNRGDVAGSHVMWKEVGPHRATMSSAATSTSSAAPLRHPHVQMSPATRRNKKSELQLLDWTVAADQRVENNVSPPHVSLVSTDLRRQHIDFSPASSVDSPEVLIILVSRRRRREWHSMFRFRLHSSGTMQRDIAKRQRSQNHFLTEQSECYRLS